MSVYQYVCNTCGDANFVAVDTEFDAWAMGIEHYNSTQHEGGHLRTFDGAGQHNGELYEPNPGQHPHHHSHHHHSHEHGEEPHIF